MYAKCNVVGYPRFPSAHVRQSELLETCPNRFCPAARWADGLVPNLASFHCQLALQEHEESVERRDLRRRAAEGAAPLERAFAPPLQARLQDGHVAYAAAAWPARARQRRRAHALTPWPQRNTSTQWQRAGGMHRTKLQGEAKPRLPSAQRHTKSDKLWRRKNQHVTATECLRDTHTRNQGPRSIVCCKRRAHAD